MSGDHSNYSIVEIDKNTEKSPGDLRRLAATQTLVKDHQLTFLGKIRTKKYNNINYNNWPQNKTEGKWKKEGWVPRPC